MGNMTRSELDPLILTEIGPVPLLVKENIFYSNNNQMKKVYTKLVSTYHISHILFQNIRIYLSFKITYFKIKG